MVDGDTLEMALRQTVLVSGEEGRVPADLVQRLHALEQRDAAMTALQETALDLAGSQDTDSILRAIVRRARQLVRADLCYFSVLEDETGDFCARVAEGATSSVFADLRMAKDHGVLGHVTRTKAPFFTSDYLTDQKIVHDPYVDSALTREGVISLLGVPLIARDELLGVFFIGDRSSRIYRPEEIGTLNALANHAALALANARMLDQTRTAYDLVEQQQSEVVAAARAHEQMTDLLARGGSTGEMVQLVAGLLDRRAYLVDAAGRDAPLGFSNSIITAALSESLHLGRSVRLQDGEAWRLSAITSSGELLGGLLVDATDLAGSSVRTIERAAMVMGILMLSEERLTIRSYSQANDLLAALLIEPNVDERQLRHLLARHDVDLERSQGLVMIDCLDARRPSVLSVLRAVLGRGALIGEHGPMIIVLTPEEKLEAEVQQLRKRAEDGSFTLNMAVAASVTGVRGLREEAERCLRVLRLQGTLGERGVTSRTDRLAIYAMLFDRQSRTAIEAFVRSTVGVLVEKDRTTSSDLVTTLLTFVESGHSVRAAGEVLGIHANTVRQRLDTIGAAMGDWSRPGRLFEIHAALRLHSMRGLT